MADRRKNHRPEDDGYTVAPMDVDGMPWHIRRPEEPRVPGSGTEMTRQERRAFLWAAVRSALLIGAVYAAVFAAFIAFCTQVWFR